MPLAKLLGQLSLALDDHVLDVGGYLACEGQQPIRVFAQVPCDLHDQPLGGPWKYLTLDLGKIGGLYVDQSSRAAEGNGTGFAGCSNLRTKLHMCNALYTIGLVNAGVRQRTLPFRHELHP